MKRISLLLSILIITIFSFGQQYNTNKFRQLKQELPTPNVYRTAAGAPGHGYYQQKADYELEITLDDKWLHKAKKMTDYCFDNFYDDKSKMFYFTSDSDSQLITRKIETDDKVTETSWMM